ncbi:Predicted acyltransferase [bacterium A37T11]|nr:Predicted acyltransferase [bacterium A37T11]
MAEVLSFKTVSNRLPDNIIWKFLSYNQRHVEWAGFSLHDIIQPSFTMLVGVVLPYSIAGRIQSGESVLTILIHTLKRSFILICLGIFLRSTNSAQTNFTFEDTLTQIGLGYTFLVLISFTNYHIQVGILISILLMYGLLFALYPLPGTDFNYSLVGMEPNWAFNYKGFWAHWNKNTNVAWAFDTWFLNLFPRESTFLFNRGGYTTLNFIPTLGTMILGLFAGHILKNTKPKNKKLRQLIILGLTLCLSGLIAHILGINPIVKRIWTPAWVLFSGGLCYWFLAFFYYIIDVSDKGWTLFVLKVIGINSIAAYIIADAGIKVWISKSLYIHLGSNYDQIVGPAYTTLISGALVLLFEWLILYWMFKKKIFLKI